MGLALCVAAAVPARQRDGELADWLDRCRNLPVDGTLRLVLDTGGVTLEVEGRHEVEGLPRPQVFLRRTLELLQ